MSKKEKDKPTEGIIENKRAKEKENQAESQLVPGKDPNTGEEVTYEKKLPKDEVNSEIISKSFSRKRKG